MQCRSAVAGAVQALGMQAGGASTAAGDDRQSARSHWAAIRSIVAATASQPTIARCLTSHQGTKGRQDLGSNPPMASSTWLLRIALVRKPGV